MSSVTDPKEVHSILNHALPNLSTFIKTILKREKLSEEAEGLRARYEALLTTLEQGATKNPVSIIGGEDDGGYFSGNRPRVSEFLDQPKGLPGINHSGYLLRRDDKYRWHRSWCRADSKEMKFFIYEDLNEEFLIRSFSLDGVTTRFGPHPVPDSDKENSFAICGIGIAIEPLILTSTNSESNDSNGLVSPAPPSTNSSGPVDEAYFAAYAEGDYRQWKDVLHMLTSSRGSSRISLSFLDNAQWLTAGAHDSTSTSSSSFGSNRESMISTTSSLVNNRISATRLDVGDGKSEQAQSEESRRLSAAKQQQPLPSPPHVPPEDVPLPDDDNASEGTIYESIDNLVSQFDDAMRATAVAMGQIGESMKSGGKKRKKKLLSKQTSFLSKAKTQKSNFLSEKKSELERGDKYAGYLFKKTSSGAWKKRWCTLKGCVFGYYKSMEETHGREYVVLDAEVNRVDDPKRSFTFSLVCKGVEEMFFAAEDDDLYRVWMSRLSNTSKNYGEYTDAWSNWQSEENLINTTLGGSQSRLNEGIYSVPRSLPLEQMLIPRAPTTMTPEAAIDSGIYSVPRFLLEQTAGSEAATPISGPAGNSSDIYNVPRPSASPDEEGIYDDPYDILGDMEIYDYPPDVNDLQQFLEDSGLGTSEHGVRGSTITTISEVTDRTSSTISDDSWRTMSLPPLPPGTRPYSMISSDEYQSNRNSTMSIESGYTFPRNQPPPDLNSVFEHPVEPAVLAISTPDYPDSSSLEFGQCIIRGHLYKKERFATWTKLYCIIRNNFLECHKSHAGGYMPALKLFLPGSEVKPGGGDSKRRHAFQVKHPRRDGMLVFATETSEEFPQWVKAFKSGASIEVQPVSTVEEMRITDLELQKRWTNPEGKDPFNEAEGWNGTLPRRKTFSNDSKPPEEYASDTLKRRRRFTLGKLTKKKKDKKMTAHTSTPELKQPLPPVPPTENFTQDRRSVSCEELPNAVEPGMGIESQQITGPDGQLRFQGYLSVHRHGANTNFIHYWCVFDGSSINCYINQLDLTLTMNVLLSGSQISDSSSEVGRPHSFKVWHMETGQCIFFAADNAHEFHKWFTMVTQNAEKILSAQQVVYFIVPGSDLTVKSFHVRQRSNSLPASPIEDIQGGDSGSVASGNTGHGSNDTPVNTFYRGYLKKASNSHSGKWKDRYCVVKDGHLSLYHGPADKSAITSIDLNGCSIELVSVPRSSTQKLVFKVNPSSSDKTHTFAAPTETEMYAWVSALRDSSYECLTRSQTELSTEGSSNGSPALSGKSSLRKRISKAKLPEADLVSYVSANSLSRPDLSGFADVQVTPDSWSRFWCVVHSNCLYIYQTQQSQATVKTVVLPGYEIHVADPLIYKRQYAILLNHSGVAPVCLAVNDEMELNQWLTALDKGARAESSAKQRKTSKHSLDELKVPSGKGTSHDTSSTKKKGPVKGDHSISVSKDGGSAVSIPSVVTPTSEAHQDSIIRRFEKRIRKTHRVANQTDDKLKEHQTALLHFKKELSKHIVKLKELADLGEASAKKRLDAVCKKVQQVDKIVPYLTKYIAVNRQAEMQTVAVLKESCTMEIQKMAKSSALPETSTPKQGAKRAGRLSREQTDNPEDSSPVLGKLVEENPYASLSEVLPQVEQVKAKSNYAQLDFTRVNSPGGSMRPPSVNYAEVVIGSGGKGVVVSPQTATPPSLVANGTRYDSTVPLEQASEDPGIESESHDNTSGSHDSTSGSHDTTLTPESAATLVFSTPAILETVNEVATPPFSPIANELPPPTQLPPIEPSEFVAPPTETAEVKPPPRVPQRSSSLEPSSPTSPGPSPVHKAPPPKVARKPAKSSTPAKQGSPPPVNGCRDSIASDLGESEREHTSPARQDVSTVLSTAPSVMDRIKALKQQN